MCVNFLTKFVHIGIKHSIIMVQVLENTYHNDDNNKKKRHFQIACPKVICMSICYHTSMS